MSALPAGVNYSPLRRLDFEMYVGNEVQFDWVVEYVDAAGTLAPAWRDELAYPPFPQGALTLFRRLDIRDGGRRLNVAAAAVFVVEARADRGVSPVMIRAARDVVESGASDDSIATFRRVPGPFFLSERFQVLRNGVAWCGDVLRNNAAYLTWSEHAIQSSAPERSFLASRKRVLRAILQAVPPPTIGEVLATLEKP